MDRRWCAEDGVEELVFGAVVGRLQFVEVERKRAWQRTVEACLDERGPVVLQDHVTTYVTLRHHHNNLQLITTSPTITVSQ